MEYYTIILRTLVIYFLIIVVFRIMGKREIGKLSIVDFVVSIMIAEIAVIAIEDPKLPMLYSLIPIFVLMAIQLILALFSLKSKKVRELVDGKPSVIINHGKIDEHEMRKQRYNFDDLMIQLRENNIKNLTDVEFGILESTGKLSVIKKDETLMLPVILDGLIQEDHLEKFGKTPFWLRRELKKLGIKDIKNISFCVIDDHDQLIIDLKDEKK
ncbi:DUF421 domain-containing protein [Fictibacillus sp. Mic-4]|uniref:DUF421 domain-containing protein n=1 Tax=Fictibacillus TaxID=1329200 RepID=UPI000423C956|nr:DUF421 domain-containing protein [Fictibacillus gelatini]